jgi:hypothetical protein
MTDEAMYQLAATLPPEYRGVYGNLDEVTQVHAVPTFEAPNRTLTG